MAKKTTTSRINNSVVQVRREADGKVVAVAYVDDECQFWAYAPEPDDFRRNQSLDFDYLGIDSRFAYTTLDADRARKIMASGAGACDPRMLPDTMARPSLSVTEVFARVGWELPPPRTAPARP